MNGGKGRDTRPDREPGGLRMSQVTLFVAAVLLALFGLLSWAGVQMGHGNPIAYDLCSNWRVLCQHPEPLGVAAVGAVIAHFIARSVRY